jgi:hypothetical protein
MSLDFFFPWIGIHAFNSFLNFMLLIGLKSEVCKSRDCQLARGGYVAIFGGLLWFVAAILLFLVRRVEDEIERDSNDVRWVDDFDEERLQLPQSDDSDEEEEDEAPLALPAPPSEKSIRSKSHSREVPLALPPSETSISPQPSAKKKKKKSGVTTKSDRNLASPSQESPEKSASKRSVAKLSDELSASLDNSSMDVSKVFEKNSKSSGSGTKTKKKKKKKVTGDSTTLSEDI